ncbi:hypothetical protein VTJ04DRAFT_10795 [Mycothermus thermophilus]|uniref:uncharacterized protein n=1 Tax=Humicola insolens TaxID=85995 RepID=UPI0037431950
MITPLGARLFAARLVPYDTPGVVVNFPSAYNSSAFMTDLRPVLAHTRSRLLSCAARIPWTDDEFGFLPFYLADEPATRLDNNTAVAKPYNLIASTTAYSAYVASTVMHATYEQGCGRAAYYSRMVFTAGKHDPNSPVWLASLTVISCATEYRTTTGLVEVSVEPEVSSPTGQTITVHHYTHISPLESEPERLGTGPAVIEWMMLSPMVFKNEHPTDFLAPEALINAIRRVFGTTYAIAVATIGFPRLLLLSRPQTRFCGGL